MVHANARLTQFGRVLLERRVRVDARPVAHVAKELGISRSARSAGSSGSTPKEGVG